MTEQGRKEEKEQARVSILLLTKNGEQYLEELLQAVAVQEGDFLIVETLAIDSGSRDQSLAILHRHGVQVMRIPPREFGHGSTRNLAASKAQGDYLVFLTQDATPAERSWLAHLLAPLLADPLVAGAYSRHLPRPDCPPMEWRQIVEFPLAGVDLPRVNAAHGNEDYLRHPEQYHFFANTSAVLCRSVWERFPFREVSFAEDQDWAKRVLEAGYKTVYASASVVFHSHHYPPWVNFLRNYDHARVMLAMFAYLDAVPLWRWPAVLLTAVTRDLRFWRRHTGQKKLRVIWEWALPSLAWHGARIAGNWLGGHYHWLPQCWGGRLSLQERRKEA